MVTATLLDSLEQEWQEIVKLRYELRKREEKFYRRSYNRGVRMSTISRIVGVKASTVLYHLRQFGIRD